MAVANWVTLDKTSGSGNGKVNVTVASGFKGRIKRETTMTIQNVNGTKPSASVKIENAGQGTITTMDATHAAIAATGGTATINGTSNSSKLTWVAEVYLNNVKQTVTSITATVKVNNAAITSNTAITGDPGATNVYTFVATVTLPATTFAQNCEVRFIVTDDASASKTCTFTWNATASTLSVSPTTMDFVNNGGSKELTINSNDSWTIS